jgi:hypothetical protein
MLAVALAATKIIDPSKYGKQRRCPEKDVNEEMKEMEEDALQKPQYYITHLKETFELNYDTFTEAHRLQISKIVRAGEEFLRIQQEKGALTLQVVPEDSTGGCDTPDQDTPERTPTSFASEDDERSDPETEDEAGGNAEESNAEEAIPAVPEGAIVTMAEGEDASVATDPASRGTYPYRGRRAGRPNSTGRRFYR